MKITENFEYIGTQQNFERDSYATLAEMKAVVDKRMPDIFTATCKETGKFYIYNKNNEVDETLGKWREISIDGDDYVTKTYLDTELANKSNIDHTHTTVNNHTVESNVPADAKFTDTVYDDTEVKAEIAKKADATSIPSKVSVLENDSKYQTELDVTTTLTDYATKTYVGEQIAASDHLKREIVTVLPTDEDAKDNIIYMLKVESATGNDKYQEYMKIDGTVQLAGDTSVDLSDYAKIDDIPTVPSKVSELENDSEYQTSTDIRPIKADISNMGLQITNLQEVTAAHSTTIGNLKQYKADKSEMLVLIDGCAKPSDLHSHTNKELLDKITTDRAYGWDAAKTHADSEHAPVNARANIIETVKVNGAALEVSDKAVNVIVPTKVSELTDSSDYAKKTDIPTTLPANGGNADTVNNHTVKSDVPENAVFTDTTYESVTQTEDGLMSAADKTKLDGINVSKVGSVSKGSETKPIYLSSGVPTECSYTLGTACQKAYTDSSAASAIGTGTSLVTERDVYYGLPKFNGGHSYTSGNDYYAAESAGTEGYILKSGGAGKAPVWSNNTDIVYRKYKLTSNISNNLDKHRYLYLGTMEGDSSKVSFDLIIEGVRSSAASRNHFDIILSTALGYQIGSIISCSSPNILAKAIVLANNNEAMTDHSSDMVFNVYFDLKALTGDYLGAFSSTFGAGYDEFAISIANLTAESNAIISLIDEITETNNKSELSYKCIITSYIDEIVCGNMLIGNEAILMHGFGNTVSAPSYAILIGYKCSINNNSGVCIGEQNTNTGSRATTLGEFCTAAAYAQAFGYNSNASNPGMMAIGHNNASPTRGGSNTNTSGTAFAIGKGTSTSSKSNAFSVSFTGVVKSASTMTAATTADYAEYFEWQDGNPNGEDRVGKFVTIDGDKIKVATEGDYILGIVSGQPFLLGNGDCDTWNGMYLRDEFNRIKYEPAPRVEFISVVNEDGVQDTICKEVEGEFEGTRPVLNPDYDPNLKYINRADRPEWSPIGMLGVLAVLHDGTAEVNGYVTVNNEGIATKCTRDTRNSYRVIKKVSDKVVEVIFR